MSSLKVTYLVAVEPGRSLNSSIKTTASLLPAFIAILSLKGIFSNNFKEMESNKAPPQMFPALTTLILRATLYDAEG